MIAGAISHICLTGGWLARKSPPYTVSSKCFHGESPSPLVLTAPLMPPCAQTECERLTGTTEKRSTACPASAIFIAAANPASPPPTMAILMPLLPTVAISVKDTSQQSSRTNEGDHRVDADQQQHRAERDAGVTCQTLSLCSDGNAPVNHE